jgi:hypothetical protein
MVPPNAGTIHQSTWGNIPKDLNFYHYCENLQSCKYNRLHGMKTLARSSVCQLVKKSAPSSLPGTFIFISVFTKAISDLYPVARHFTQVALLIPVKSTVMNLFHLRLSSFLNGFLLSVIPTKNLKKFPHTG